MPDANPLSALSNYPLIQAAVAIVVLATGPILMWLSARRKEAPAPPVPPVPPPGAWPGFYEMPGAIVNQMMRDQLACLERIETEQRTHTRLLEDLIRANDVPPPRRRIRSHPDDTQDTDE